MLLSGDRTDSGDDIRVGAATTEIAAHSFTDFFIGQFHMTLVCMVEGYSAQIAPLVLRKKRNGRANLARRAVSALQSVEFEKSGLHRVKGVVLREALNRGDLGTAGGCGECETTEDPMSVHNHRASTALAVIATLFASAQMEMVAQRIKKRGP